MTKVKLNHGTGAPSKGKALRVTEAMARAKLLWQNIFRKFKTFDEE